MSVSIDEPEVDLKFAPRPCGLSTSTLSYVDHDSTAGLEWLPVLESPVPFEPPHFVHALEEILLHPERNTSLILRADVLSDGAPLNAPESTRRISGYSPTRNLLRRLVPRQKNRDASLDQDCTILVLDEQVPPTAVESALDHDDASPKTPTLVVLSPRFASPDDNSLPWYHPPVRHIAFRYIPATPIPSQTHEDHSTDVLPSIRLEVVLLDPQDAPPLTETSSRLYRTCLALLETAFRFGKGKMTGYKKRVIHDTLVPKEEFQDLYMLMRDKFKDIADTWHESTDASKHVFEDISIATFLMLLWNHTYPPLNNLPDGSKNSGESEDDQSTVSTSFPWSMWGRPAAGFLDFGCGNGLLVHILLECGYSGLGVDLRARKSWAHYPSSTRDHLHVYAFDPTAPELAFLLSSTSASAGSGIEAEMFGQGEKGRFIIGNHADELQPWVPVLAALTNAEYLSIPCCAWEFDQRFHMKKKSKKSAKEGAGASTGDPSVLDEDGIDGEGRKELDELEVKLKHGEVDGAMSLYGAYVLWLAGLSRRCGFAIESEALRIPSTRNRAIIGRKRIGTRMDDALREDMISIVRQVEKRGMFKARIPEGKAGFASSGAEVHEEDSDEPVRSNGGRPKEQADPIFRLKGLGIEDAPRPAVYRPTELGWGSGGLSPSAVGTNGIGRGRGFAHVPPRKSRLSQ